MKSANREIGGPRGSSSLALRWDRRASPRESGVSYIDQNRFGSQRRLRIPNFQRAVGPRLEGGRLFVHTRLAHCGAWVSCPRVQFSRRAGILSQRVMTAAVDLGFFEARLHHPHERPHPHKPRMGHPESILCDEVPQRITRGLVRVRVRGGVGRDARRKISTRGSGKCG